MMGCGWASYVHIFLTDRFHLSISISLDLKTHLELSLLRALSLSSSLHFKLSPSRALSSPSRALSLDLEYLFSITSRSPLLHSISKLSSPNPYLPFLVEMYLRFRCLMGFSGLVFAGIYQQVFTPISSITEEDYVLSFDSVVCANSEMSDLFFFLLSSLKRLTICRGSDQAVVPLQAQTLSKLRPSLVRNKNLFRLPLLSRSRVLCLISIFSIRHEMGLVALCI
uniref:Uncharacterized protein n=1 Tax=Brassica oleracea TaxID=3712 RepID=A0A3P6GTC5_BRAOL|nr:unnamed protein product [Brassica oleracea]